MSRLRRAREIYQSEDQGNALWGTLHAPRATLAIAVVCAVAAWKGLVQGGVWGFVAAGFIVVGVSL